MEASLVKRVRASLHGTKTNEDGSVSIRPLVIRMNNPCIVSEFEKYADAVLVNFGVETKAALTIISGGFEPSALLPVQLPKDIETVEKHCEDKAFDYEPYTDSCGNTYDFGFGLNWSGPIHDNRYDKYVI